MPDYKSMYYALAAQVATAVELLLKAQQNGEEAVMQEDNNCTGNLSAKDQSEDNFE